jgi:adenylate cyclase class 2
MTRADAASWRPEYEAKFLDVDAPKLRSIVDTLTVLEHHPRYLMRRKLFDTPARDLRSEASWLRVRDQGDGVFLTLKRQRGSGIDGIAEREVEVSDFDETCGILRAIGLVEVAHQENWRERWVCGGFELSLDEWPWVPPFLEIEGPTADAVRSAAALLGLAWSEALMDSVDGVYERYYPSVRDKISSLSLGFDVRPAALAGGT